MIVSTIEKYSPKVVTVGTNQAARSKAVFEKQPFLAIHPNYYSGIYNIHFKARRAKELASMASVDSDLNEGWGLVRTGNVESATSRFIDVAVKAGDNPQLRAKAIIGCGHVALEDSGAKKLQEAAVHFTEALKLSKNPLDRAKSLNGLGTVFFRLNDYDKAIKYFEQARNLLTRNSKTKLSSELAECLGNAAAIHILKGKSAEQIDDNQTARQEFRQAKRLLRKAKLIADTEKDGVKVLDKNSPTMAELLNTHGVYYFYQGNYSAAEPYFKKSYEITAGNLGQDHPKTRALLFDLADSIVRQERYDEAEALYLDAAKKCERNSDYYSCANILAIISEFSYARGSNETDEETAQEAYEKAKTYRIKSIKILEGRQEYGKDHISLIPAYLYLSQIQYALGNKDRSRMCQIIANSIAQKNNMKIIDSEGGMDIVPADNNP